MRVKKGIILLAFALLLTAGSVFAHDKGDLMLHIEPQFSFSLPIIGMPINESNETYNYYSDAAGFGFGVRERVYYWFLPMFGVSAGLGYSVVFDGWKWGYTRQDSNNSRPISGYVFFTRGYLSTPFGANFSMGSFAAGAGVSLNLMLHQDASAQGEDKENYDWFRFRSYAGWYADVGLDTSGRAGAGRGFGVLLRFSGSFGNNLARFSAGRDVYQKLPYRDLAVSVVLSPAMQLASLPIGGKTDNAP